MPFSLPRRARHAFSALACLAAVALPAAGCGGGAQRPSVASLGTTSTTSTKAPAPTHFAGGGVSPRPIGGQGNELTMAGGSRTVLAAYAACMRQNGEPNFPDPNAQGQLSFGSANGIDPNSPQFQQAQSACQKLLPNHGTPSPAQESQARAQALAFSACMRKNGVPSFPDPQFGPGGRVSIRLSVGAGTDPQSPQFQAAQKVCQKDIPGKFGSGSAASGATKAG